jgi:hypothetical protein
MEARDEWRPVAEYRLVGDCNSAALVDRGGSIDWLCFPRYDSDALFARLLDPDTGHWSIAPTGSHSSGERRTAGQFPAGVQPHRPDSAAWEIDKAKGDA